MSTEKTNTVVDPQKFLEPCQFMAISRSSSVTGLTAGTTQTQAGAVKSFAAHTRVSTTANANDGVQLPPAKAGMLISVTNAGASNLKLWPADGEKVNTGTADAADAVVLATTKTRLYFAFADGDFTKLVVE